ncbi:nitroreductase [Polymorphobacter fuscus]|uniref:Nitroreductase n=1 Tax=Sandarakinorhabdus fusca TaxID=1439888 RepID=A0A7C9GMY3_9SPHN|nr:nitroreductase [Polymorphobacter fuscus]KAB7648793.1 nitroreductase [Polymorphobacter fuscus]MQT16372.1 nitroreductase [Polymorphobacter fuscus]NJC07339.1 nitroreductase [Polymorphobacter fuscus]
MDVNEALATRRSVRGFLDTPVDPAVIRRVVEAAARAPSGGNVQPWHIDVVAGDRLEALKTLMRTRLAEAPGGEPTEYDIYPKTLPSPYRDYRFAVGEALYGALGIPRADKMQRLMWFARNFQFFGAPVALFCSVARTMGPPQWSDLGMYLQSLMLLLRAEGLDSCAQECWAIYPATIRGFIGIPEDRMLFTGMAIGFRDEADPANAVRSERAPLADFATFHGL